MMKDFDKIFKSKLENHTSEFPADMWDNIEAAIAPPKRNNRYGLYFLIFASVCASIVGLLELAQANENNLINPSLSVETENILPSSSFAEVKTIEQLENSTLYKETQNKTEYQNKTETISAVTIKEEAVVTQSVSEAELYAESTQLNVPRTYESSKEIQTVPETEVSKLTNKTLVQESIKEASDFSQRAINKRKITFTEPFFNSPSRDQNSSVDDVDDSESIQKEKTEKINSQIMTSMTRSSKNYNQPISTLPSLYELKMRQPLKELDMAVAVPAGTDCPSWVKEKLGLYLEAYYAPEYGIRSFTAKERDSTIIAHQNSRNDTEEALVSFSLGARAMFMTPSGISFKLGVNYSQINERFTWQDPESIREITIVDTDPISGDTLNTYVTYEYGTEVEERINKYKSIDIPILIGYEKHFKKKLSFSMNAGIYLNLIAKQRGMFIDPTGDRSWFSSDDGTYDVYKRSMGVSFFASGGLMYHWVDGIDFFAEPSLRFYTQSLTLDNYPLNQDYVVLGIHTGIRYKF